MPFILQFELGLRWNVRMRQLSNKSRVEDCAHVNTVKLSESILAACVHLA